MLSFAIKGSALEFNWRFFSSCMILKLQGQIMVLSKCIFRRKFKCRQFWQQQFSTFSCNPKTSDSIYFTHRLEIGKNITISSFKVRPLQWFWCLFEIYVLQEFFHWHLYLCISSFLCNCIWVSEVMYLCVRVFADIPWSMRACIAMCGAAWCQRKPSAELGWKGSGYEERNGIIQKHHLHLPPSNHSTESVFEALHNRQLSDIWLIWENSQFLD